MILFDGRWALTENGEIYLNASWTQSDSGYDALQMAFAGDVPVALFPDGLPGPGADPTAPLAFSDYDFGPTYDYSNLDYTEMRTTLGLRFQIQKNIGLFGSISHYDVQDDQPYLEDFDGTVDLIAGGLTWSF